MRSVTFTHHCSLNNQDDLYPLLNHPISLLCGRLSRICGLHRLRHCCGLEAEEARARRRGCHRVWRGSSRIGIAKSIDWTDPPWTFIGDTTTNIEGVASDTSDLVDVMSHEEAGIVDGHITCPIKGRLHLVHNRTLLGICINIVIRHYSKRN